jgi:hypothetical protein
MQQQLDGSESQDPIFREYQVLFYIFSFQCTSSAAHPVPYSYLTIVWDTYLFLRSFIFSNHHSHTSRAPPRARQSPSYQRTCLRITSATPSSRASSPRKQHVPRRIARARRPVARARRHGALTRGICFTLATGRGQLIMDGVRGSVARARAILRLEGGDGAPLLTCACVRIVRVAAWRPDDRRGPDRRLDARRSALGTRTRGCLMCIASYTLLNKTVGTCLASVDFD